MNGDGKRGVVRRGDLGEAGEYIREGLIECGGVGEGN